VQKDFGGIRLGKLHAKARIIQGFEIAMDNGRSHCTVSDQPRENFPGLGPTPLELCIMSHAGCYATIAALTAQKMRLQLRGCEVKVEALKSEEAGTIVEETFDILFKIDAPEEKIQRLHEVTLKNCPVGVLFEKAGVKISYNIKTQKQTNME
jgi:putative redox protein